MIAYILRRLLTAVPLVIAISIACFVVIQLPPGDFGSKYKQDLIDRGGLSEHEAQEQADIITTLERRLRKARRAV